MPYEKLNAQTAANVIAQDPLLQKQAWAVVNVRKSNDYSVLYDGMVGPMGSGKPFIAHNDLEVKSGNTVNVPLVGGSRNRGTQGEGDRDGTENRMTATTFAVKIGRWFNAYAIKSVAMAETVIGEVWDTAASMFLRRNLGIKKTDDMLLELRVRATARNTVRPNNKASRDALRSNDVFSTTTLLRAVSVLTSLGAKAARLGKSTAGAEIRKFLFLDTQFGLEPFENSQTYLDAATNADERGAANALFTGNILPWKGHWLYKWLVEDPDDAAPAGCPLLRRAFLGIDIAANSATGQITGGGGATNAAFTDIDYFGYFSNALIAGCEGTKRAADTTTVRYIAFQVLTGADAGKIAYASYKVNDRNQLTMFQRLGSSAGGSVVSTLGAIPWGAGTYGSNNIALLDSTAIIPAGSLIVEVNNAGVSFTESFALGEMAGVISHGSVDGEKAIGKRTEEHRNYEMDHGIGLETAFGARAFERIDKQPGGYVLIESALSLQGFPIV